MEEEILSQRDSKMLQGIEILMWCIYIYLLVRQVRFFRFLSSSLDNALFLIVSYCEKLIMFILILQHSEQ